MRIFTNSSEFGGRFADEIDNLLPHACDITIASAYTSEDTLRSYRGRFSAIAEAGGGVTLLIGMALFQGLHRSTYNTLSEINRELLHLNPGCKAVRVVWHPCCFHGKLYRIQTKNNVHLFAGSSNFSRAGLADYLEFMTEITHPEAISEADSYLEWLLRIEHSVNIGKCTRVPLIEDTISVTKPKRAEVSEPTEVPSGVPYVDISLSRRISRQQGSNLNAFFGKGRLNTTTGEVTPRDWFEVEVIAGKEERENPAYPKGDFVAITEDGEMECRTQGDGHKNLRSKGDLSILGRFLKGKLQRSCALMPFEPVTAATFEAYGRGFVRLHRISEGKYFMEF